MSHSVSPRRRGAFHVLVVLFLVWGNLAAAWAGRPEGPAASVLGTGIEQRPADTALSRDWVIEQVDGPRALAAAYEHNLSLDSGGNPHVAYGDAQLSYAWRDGLGWHVEMVDRGGMSSLELDSFDRPHIAYSDGSTVKYAWHDGAAWQIQVVGSGTEPALALDASGRPHLAYTSWPGTELAYAYLDAGVWITATVDTTGEEATMGLDGSGRPHIAYYSSAQDSLRYATYDGVWVTETITSSLNGRPVSGPSLVVDGDGRPHVAYMHTVWAALRYAYRDQGSWHIETLDESVFGSWFGCSLALDVSGRPHVVYSDYGYTFHGYRDGTGWTWTQIDDSGDGSSVIVGQDGVPRVFYAHFLRSGPWGTIDAMRYAWAAGNGWQMEIVDANPAGGSGAGASVVLDAADHAHISYLESNPLTGSGYARYAHYDGHAWQRERVASGTNVYLDRTSLALDSGGRPHLVVDTGWSNTNQVVYLHLDGSAWVSETIGLGDMPSFALDGSGGPHVVYTEEWSHLVYAWYDLPVWRSERITFGSGPMHPSLALDAAGAPQISFSKCAGDEKTYYASMDSSGWRIETVDVAGCGPTSLALDAAGRPHVGYVVAVSGTYELRYAVRSTAGWITSTVDIQPPYQSHGGLSMALDSYGQPYMAWASWDTLYYVYHTTRGWELEAVTEGAFSGPALALDSQARPRIAFQAGETLQYAYITGCLALETLSVQGPARLPTGITGYYTPTYAPPTATLPQMLWDDGLVALTRPMSWTVPGTQTLAVTATNTCSSLSTSYTVTTFCQPVQTLALSGPLRWPAGITAWYTASYSPPTSSLPLTVTWNNGSTGPAAPYSWTEPATYTVAVTSTNCGGSVGGELTVTVFCQPLLEVTVEGPLATLVGQPTAYTAVTGPITASRPLTLTWDNGASGPEATYTWPATGTYTVTVTATNPCGAVVHDSFSLRVLAKWPYARAVPVAYRAYAPGLCTPVTGVTVDGPEELLVGQTGSFEASYAPPEATLPVGLAWDNGSIGPTAIYSWTVAGQYTLTVTATNPCGQVSGAHAVAVVACQPVATAAITGPLVLPAGQTTLYTATFSPPTATLPLTLTWDNGAVGPTAAYSWSVAGLYTLTVTATNPCGRVSATLGVSVTPAACQPVQTASISGPVLVQAGVVALYTATVSPPTATQPLTYTWDNGSLGPSAAYSWSLPGVYTLTVTVTNACGTASGTLVVTVGPPVAERLPAPRHRLLEAVVRRLLC